MSDFNLHINGWKYFGWTRLQVTRGIEQFAHSFMVALVDKWKDKDIPVSRGDACQVSYNNDWVTSGYVTECRDEYDADSDSISITGRSSTGDLVDCSAVHRQFNGQGLLKIAEKLCAPFGINVSSNTDLGAVFRIFEVEDGETVFSAISRAAKRRGVLVLTKADGNLVFDRVGSTKVKTRLERGVNILKGSKVDSEQDRFSVYTVKTQTQGNDNLFGSAAASISRSAADDGVNRYRPLVIAAEDEDSGSELQKRVNWERNIRAGRSLRVSYTVPGWEHDDGLWEPNTMVRVVDSRLRLDDDLLITEVTHLRGENDGTTTAITVTFPEAFDVQPLPKPKKKAGSLF